MEVTEVFGVSNKEVKTYIERKSVDDLFKRGLDTNKHIIVFGSSKQGKTALTNRHLTDEQVIKVNCAPETTPLDIYQSILRQLNIGFEIEKKVSDTSGGEVSAGITAKVKIPFFSGGSKLEGQINEEKSQEITYQKIDFNLALPQDVSEILQKMNFDKKIFPNNITH